MRLTRFGFGVVLAALVTMFGAAASGNNLLYLVNGMIISVLAVSAFAARRNLSGLGAEASVPTSSFQGTELSLSVLIRNPRRRAAHRLDAAAGAERRSCRRLEGRSAAAFSLPATLPRRGRNILSGLVLESSYPFGIFRRRVDLAPVEALAFPHLDEVPELRPSRSVRQESVALPKRGVGDEFHGLREYGDGDDARLIDWKATARTGTPLVREYAHYLDNRITITVEGKPGPSTEREISEAASAARFHIDAGAEVRLVTDEGGLDYGRGLLHLEAILEKLALLGNGKEARRTAFPSGDGPSAPPPFQAPPAALYITAAISLASLLLVEELNPLAVLLFAPLILLSVLFDRKRFHPLPRPALDVLSVLFLLYFLFIDIRFSGSQKAVIHLVLFILAYLLLLPKSGRQVRQLFLACFLAFYMASGQAVSLWYFAFFLAYFAAAGAWLNEELARTLRKRWQPGAATLAGLVLVSFGLASASFAFMPRLYSPRMQRFLAAAGLSRFQAGERSFAGLTERVELGWMGPLRKNFARVMQVALPDLPKDAPPPAFIRVRGGAFDAFDGRRWRKTHTDFAYESGGRRTATRHALAWLRRDGRMLVSPAYDPTKPASVAEFIIFPLLNTSLVFGLGDISAIEGGPAGAFFDFTDTVSFSSSYAEGGRYRLLSQSETPSAFRLIEDYDRILKDKYLGLPGDGARYAALAREFAGGAVDAIEAARAIEARFRAGFSYSLAADAGRQSLDDFLFGSRAGNCEFFATAMCVLLRAAGTPSRLVIGFLGEEWNAYGRFFDIRQSDAHAWVEAYFPGRGWETFDPTPSVLGSSRAPGLLARLWGVVDQAFQTVQFRWYRYVVGFDTETRQNALYGLELNLGPAFLKALPFLALAFGAAAGFALLKPGRRLAKRRSRRRPGPGNGAYGEILERLARAGYRREPWQTGREFAAEVVRRSQDLAAWADLTELHYRARFSGRSVSASEAEEARRLAGLIAAALGASKRLTCPPGGITL
jgi:uncharacterized protein (DUF58 family)